MSQQINLFNPIFLKKKKFFTALPMVKALGVILVGALALCWVAGQRVNELELRAKAGKTALAAREVKLNHAIAQFAPRAKTPALEVELAQAEAELKAMQDAAKVLQGGALGNKDGYAEYFRAFSRQNISGLWLTGFSIVGAGTDIGLQGRAMQAALIPSYIARLTSERIMRGKTFASLHIGRPMTGATEGAAAPAAEPAAPSLGLSPELAALAGLVTGKGKEKAKPAPAALAPAAPATAAAPASPLAAFVEFNLQSTAVVEGAK